MVQARHWHASRAIPVDPASASDRVLPMPLTAIFDRWYGPLPRVVAVTDDAGDWGTAGQTRTVHTADRGSSHERLTAVGAPHHFGYELTPMSGPLAALVERDTGDWRFGPIGTGTEISWDWHVVARSALTDPALTALGVAWRGYARRALHRISDELLAPAPHAS